MLRRFRARGFKSLADVDVDLPRFSVFFGPNAAGKSNLLDALQALSRLASEPTIGDAMQQPIRGFPIEAFAFPRGGLPELLNQPEADFTLGADVATPVHGDPGGSPDRSFRYSVTIRIVPATGALAVHQERLAELTNEGQTKSPLHIGRDGDDVWMSGHAGEPFKGMDRWQERTMLGWADDPGASAVKLDLARWRAYYLDPRAAMRQAATPTNVFDIGPTGSLLAPYLYNLQRGGRDAYRQFQRVVRSVLPAVREVSVDLDRRRGTLDIQVEQDGTVYSSRVISEGTLRVLALCALVVNPEPPTLIAYEEPENGVHPARLDVVAKLLMSIADRRRPQLIVTTHSPQFASTVLRLGREEAIDTGLFTVALEAGATRIRRFEPTGSLLDDAEIREALTTPDEAQVFEAMLRRGWLDE